jgi:hypothetical protein
MPVIIEDLYVDWISKEIADYFQRLGYRVNYTAVSQPVEKTYPFDRLYAIGSDLLGIAIFAVQFKAPDRHKYGLRFLLDLEQLKQLKRGEFLNWIYYGFPYFTRHIFQSNCLHLVNFVKPLSVPPLDKLDINFVLWQRPYYFIEFDANVDKEILDKDIEMYKAFDEFYGEKNKDFTMVLTRKSCVYLPDVKKQRYEIPHCSWGELFNSLRTKTSGKYFNNREELEEFLSILYEVNYKPSNAILMALDSIRQVVRIFAILARHENKFGQSEDEMLF